MPFGIFMFQRVHDACGPHTRFDMAFAINGLFEGPLADMKRRAVAERYRINPLILGKRENFCR
jgi:hypothetical protein